MRKANTNIDERFVRNQLVLFDENDIFILLETQFSGGKAKLVHFDSTKAGANTSSSSSLRWTSTNIEQTSLRQTINSFANNERERERLTCSIEGTELWFVLTMFRTRREVSLSDAKKSMISAEFGNVIRRRNEWNQRRRRQNKNNKKNTFQEEHPNDRMNRLNIQIRETEIDKLRRSSQLDPTHD
jgi:hypothetical protein